MNIRQVLESDYIPVISVIDDWWGGRHMADMLPKLFFQHFRDTSFVAESDGQMRGFLIGFVSQTYPTEAYVHFIGVHPEYRGNGVAKCLYRNFFATAYEKGCKVVRCVTSPVNETSISFHIRMGFRIEKGSNEIGGTQFTADYDGKGQDRVLFAKELE